MSAQKKKTRKTDLDGLFRPRAVAVIGASRREGSIGRQVMANLISNAEKYAGGASRVHLGRDEDFAFIVVEDDGPGIGADEMDRIFDRFSRGTEGGNRGADTGVGLGLSLVAEHVALHGGSVWAEPKPDGEQGGRFVVALPLPHPEEMAHHEQHDEVMA